MTRSLKVGRRTFLQGTSAFLATGAPAIARAQAADVPIGLVLPFTGATGSYGPDMKKAGELAASMVNDAGGVLGGRKLRLFIEDEETSATALERAPTPMAPSSRLSGRTCPPASRISSPRRRSIVPRTSSS